MYTILLNESNELTTSVRERIMQRSKLVDSLHFLVDPIYKGINMSDFTVMMEYILPISREYKTEYLVKSDALYKEKLEYKLPFDTCLTKEAGKIDGLKDDFARFREEVRVDRAKTNTRLNILIAILSTLAVPIVGVCVKLLFG